MQCYNHESKDLRVYCSPDLDLKVRSTTNLLEHSTIEFSQAFNGKKCIQIRIKIQNFRRWPHLTNLYLEKGKSHKKI